MPIQDRDEKKSPRVELKAKAAAIADGPQGMPQGPIVAAKYDPDESWDEIRTHVGRQLRPEEEIGSISIHIVTPGTKESRFMTYFHKDFTVGTSATIAEEDDVEVRNLTLINTGAPNYIDYCHYADCYWVCFNHQ